MTAMRTIHRPAAARALRVQRLLAVNLNYLGDALFTTPALAALRSGYPATQIDVLAGARAAEILDANPDVDAIHLRPPRRGQARNAALLRTLRSGRYDAVVLFQSIFSNAALAWAAHIPVRVGFAQDGCSPFLTDAVSPPRPDEHRAAAYLRLAAAFPLAETRDARLKVVLAGEDRAFAREFLSERSGGDRVVGLVIGATRPQKSWPEAYWAMLADKLWSAGIRSVLLGGPDEVPAARNILARTRSPLISAVGHTKLKQLAALIGRCGVVVSGDTGPMHIAAAMDTPVVALFGSTDPGETGPWYGGGVAQQRRGLVLYDALPCAPCRKSPTCEGRFDCLRSLTPERAFDAVAEQLDISPRQVLPVITSGKVIP
jgi:heptosyltransferase-1